ncbi:MAG: tetratricopeptide repeat protein [Gemmatimonadota bacterium]
MTVRSELRYPSIWLVAFALAACSGDGAEEAESLALDFPPPPAESSVRVTGSDFAGAEACMGCHADQYEAWSTSTHGRAGGAPSAEVVIAAFDGRPIRFADGVVTPRVRAGTWEFEVRQDGFAPEVYRVSGVIGGAHMLGGGTQGFVTTAVDGTERFLPWDWSGSSDEWFCNTGSRTNQGWEPIVSGMRMADCGDWPPLRPLGTVDRFANCQECHGSQIQTTLDPGVGFATEYTTLQVNCESCHGPAADHVERASLGAEDLGIESLAFLGKDEALETCFQCHALKDVLKEGYLPGEDFETHYALKYPVLGDAPYFPDGRVRSFAYQANHLASACYLQGPMDCASCHEPHGQGYWDIDRRPLASPFDDGQCTSCHASKAVEPAAHTFHPPESDGARCVSCHMPYLQHPEVGDGVAFARSDHTISIPRPVFDADLGLESACAQCHTEQTPLELQSQVRQWWGETKPHRPLVSGIAGEFRARNLGEAGELLLRPESTDPLIQFQALSRIVIAYVQADVLALPPEVESRLLALTASDDLDVRSLALATLHFARGEDPAIRARLVDALTAAPEDEALRSRWRLALGFLGDRARDDGDFATSQAAYTKALELSPGDPSVLHALGQMHNRAGAYPLAIESIRSSLDAAPGQPLAWVNLGIALAGDGRPAEARDAYAEALRLNPHEALAHFNLGNSFALAQRYEDAAAAYAAAVAADPGLGIGHFELGRTYIRLERFEEALPAARRAVEFLPDHGPSRQMLADLEAALSG